MNNIDKTALLLIAHGSRRSEANADLRFIADQIGQRQTFMHIQCSYLELAEPSIEQGGDWCVEHGAEAVVMMPYFLSPGIHVVEDMVEAKSTLESKYPHVRFTLADPLGRHPKLIEVVLERVATAK
jgi:sirohydrochlorin ferrochelatase